MHTTAYGIPLDVGSSIGTLVRDTGFANWNRYAAVNDEFIPIHMDAEAARATGMPGAFAQGNLLLSYVHVLMREWMGGAGRVRLLSMQFRKPAFAGLVTATGTITAVTPGFDSTEVELELSVTDAAGNVLTPGTATVVFASV